MADLVERLRVVADWDWVDGESSVIAEAADEIARLTAELEAAKAENAELITWGRRMQAQAGAMVNYAHRLAEDASRQALALYDTATAFAPKALAQPGARQGERANG
jgi:hypothetical protein